MDDESNSDEMIPDAIRVVKRTEKMLGKNLAALRLSEQMEKHIYPTVAIRKIL